ncbi:Endonuclease/Exonuclease/phosphatase family [Phytophthora infestans]|uniref:Endonuclease/Exonuclease/phosphatase family n=1 Tax=Phytophthora infestans TaxID=4787 RepID=A0A833W6P6_PHYIN|nr:Endonuclease/Exonuclease/phosphatase family [Phytophthora infestans]
MVFNKERWENRVIKHSVCYSPTRRSMCVAVRLAKARELWMIGTYIHHSPERHLDEVHDEWAWEHERVVEGRARCVMVVVAGDFNTYTDDVLDRPGTTVRSASSQAVIRQFAAWTDSLGLVSTFRCRHPTTPRYTYSRQGTRSTLDDIYISGEHETAITASAMWINSVTTSDHAGVPMVVMRTDRGARIAFTLQHITPIKVVNTRQKTKEEMQEFTEHTRTMLHSGEICLIDDIEAATSTPEEILVWLEQAIDNLYSCLYLSARNLWGESNQSKRQLARAVCIKRSNRCTAQLRQARIVLDQADITIDDI